MPQKAHALILWRHEHALWTLEELADSAGLHPKVVEMLVRSGLIEPSATVGFRPLFAPATEERLRRIMRLRRDLGVNLAGAAVILEMREHLQNVQIELERLRRRSSRDGNDERNARL